MSFARYFNRA